MAATIESLRRDHRNFEQLLKVLDQEVAVFEKAERPDYEIIEAVIRYFEDYPARCHHPKEDIVFEKLRLRDADAARAVGDLEAEHVELAARLRDLSAVVDEVLGEVDMPREILGSAARKFMEGERTHMKKEEEMFFAAAEKALTEDDWAEVDRRVTDEADPLFAGRPEERFAALQRRIVKWEKEDQAARS